MRDHLYELSRFLFCRRRQLFLALCCLAGLILGSALASRASETYLLMTRMAPVCHVSVPGLIASVYLPFLFAAFAVFLSRPALLALICFAKMLLFAWCGCSVVAVFGSAGWLVQLLLQFTDLATLPALCWFCIRHTNGADSVRRDLLACSLWVLLMGITDLCVISPFLATLIYQ